MDNILISVSFEHLAYISDYFNFKLLRKWVSYVNRSYLDKYIFIYYQSNEKDYKKYLLEIGIEEEIVNNSIYIDGEVNYSSDLLKLNNKLLENIPQNSTVFLLGEIIQVRYWLNDLGIKYKIKEEFVFE